MALLVKAKDITTDITKQRALQFFSARKYAGFRIKFTALFGVVTVGLVWILINGIFLIAQAWVTGKMPMQEETHEAIISSGRISSSTELLFWIALFVPAALLYCLYIVVFQKHVGKEVCYKILFTWHAGWRYLQ